MTDNWSEKSEINIAEIPFPNKIWIRKETWEIIIKSSALIPIIILGIVGNILLLTIIFKNKNLHTPTNFLIVNMAATDLITLIINPWMFLCKDFYQNYILGEVGCKVEGFFEFSFLLTGVFTLVVISYNRLIAIVMPNEARISRVGVQKIMAISWILGFVIASPLIIFRTYKERQWLDFLEIFCNEDKKFLPIYWNIIIGFIIWIPLCIMIVCYSIIFYKLDQYEKNILKREHPITVNYKKKVARTMFVVVIVFVCLRVPFTAVVFRRSELLRASKPYTFGNDFAILWFTCNYLMFTNAAVNPIIYGLTNESFKKAFKSMICSNNKQDKKIWTVEDNETKVLSGWKMKKFQQEVQGSLTRGVFRRKEQNFEDNTGQLPIEQFQERHL